MRSLACVHCGTPLPLNSAIAEWPYGRMLRLDDVEELCWAGCSRCDGWTLAPDGTARDVLDEVRTKLPLAEQHQLTPLVTEYRLPEGLQLLMRHAPRPRYERVGPASAARRRRRATSALVGLLAFSVVGAQVLRADFLWPYVVLGVLAALVTVVLRGQRRIVRLNTSSAPALALTQRSGAVLRWSNDGWLLDVGDATPVGTLRALGRTRFSGLEALLVLRQLTEFRLVDGATEEEFRRAEAILNRWGNPFLDRERRDCWGSELRVTALDVDELLALELAASEALGEHDVAVRGRALEARFRAEAALAGIVRNELD